MSQNESKEEDNPNSNINQKEIYEGAYDVAYREVVADVIVIKALLIGNRPLEALNIADECERRHADNVPNIRHNFEVDENASETTED